MCETLINIALFYESTQTKWTITDSCECYTVVCGGKTRLSLTFKNPC